MGETLAIPPAATGDRSVITTHSGGPKFTGIREMRILKQNLAYEAPKVHKKPTTDCGFFHSAGAAAQSEDPNVQFIFFSVWKRPETS